MCFDRDRVAMLTRSEAEAARLVAVAMRTNGNLDAVARRFAAGWIISLGRDRYVNRALCTEPTLGTDTMATVVEFFGSRGLSPSIQVPGWVGAERELRDHGFRPDWTRSLLAAPCGNVASSTTDHVRDDVDPIAVDEEHLDSWLDVLADGNETPPSMRPISDEFAEAARAVPGSIDLLVDLGAGPVACGSVQVVDGVGWLGGAATLPGARRQGLQTTLLARRIEAARRLGARIVAATAVPGSVSERNLQRAGLEVVDTQTVWTAAT